MPYKNNEDRNRRYKERWSNDPDFRKRLQESRPKTLKKFRNNHPNYDSEWARKNNYKAQKAWKLRNKGRVNGYVAARYAKLHTTKIERIDYSQVIEQANGVCGICGGELYPPVEIDHIIPLSKGGTHTRDNLQASHAQCNRSKHTRIL